MDEGSGRRKEFYLTTHIIYKKLTAMPPAEFEPEIPASEQLQTHAIGRATAGIGTINQ